jgi:hypothetical protein
MGQTCCTHGRDEKTYILVENIGRKRPLERPRRRWQDNIKTVLKERVIEDVDWIHVAQYRDQCREPGIIVAVVTVAHFTMVRYRAHNSPQLGPIRGQTDPFHTITPHLRCILILSSYLYTSPTPD